MNVKTYLEQHFQNKLHTLTIIAGMAMILGIPSYMLAGELGLFLSILSIIASLYLSSFVSLAQVMQQHQAREASPYQEPQLFQVLYQLTLKAGLSSMPRLFVIPSPQLNAFATSSHGENAIAITRGLAHALSPSELEGVLAHEMSHIKNRDTDVFKIADAMTRLTSSLSSVGLFLGFLSLPLTLLGVTLLPFWGFFFLMLAPFLNMALQMALSRTREFAADLHATRLTGNPYGLASALRKIEQPQRGLWQWFIPQPKVDPTLNWMKTHPPTGERIERLLALVNDTQRTQVKAEPLPFLHPAYVRRDLKRGRPMAFRKIRIRL